MFAIRQPTHVFYSKKAIYSTCRGGEDSRRRVLQTEEIAHTHPQCSHILQRHHHHKPSPLIHSRTTAKVDMGGKKRVDKVGFQTKLLGERPPTDRKGNSVIKVRPNQIPAGVLPDGCTGMIYQVSAAVVANNG